MKVFSYLRALGGRFSRWAHAHKIAATFLIVVVVGGVYYGYGKMTGGSATETRYVLAAAEEGTLVNSVSGSGQVAASDQRDIKPRVSGDVVAVLVQAGQSVRTGALLMRLDMTDAQQAVNDATVTLQQAQLALQKLQGLSTSEGAIEGAKEKAQNDL
jgi:multidrug efflux pump subunit AcrA (membrane-fusion protein)